MYRAKDRAATDSASIPPSCNRIRRKKLGWRPACGNGLERGEFRVYYQPKIRHDDRRDHGGRALLRWQHREGLLLPEKFIHLAEETGLIVPIGLWTLREVCERSKAWKDAGLPRMPIAVNLSAIQFREEQLVPQLAKS